jgi:hypothetical protein
MFPEKSEMIESIQYGFLKKLHALESDTPARWGKMNAQQMVEHLIDFIGLSYEKTKFPLAVPEDMVEKYQSFLFSEKMFRENTKAPAEVLGEIPSPAKLPGLKEALEELAQTIQQYFEFFETHPDRKTLHPAFGWLDQSGWLVLHYKHMYHHLRQFGLLD